MATGSRVDCLTVCYQLTIEQRGKSRQRDQLLYVKTYPDNISRDTFREIARHLTSSAPSGNVPDIFPERNMIVWVFPNDPKLGQLARLTDAGSAKIHLPYKHLPEGCNSPEDIQSVDIDVIRYHPEVRCTLRYHVVWGKPGQCRSIQLYAKTFLNEEGLKLFHLTRDLWEVSSQDIKFFLIAKPLDYNISLKLLWQLGLKGKPASEFMGTSRTLDCIENIANGLAQWHSTTLPTTTLRITRDRLPVVQVKINRLVSAFPGLEFPLQKLNVLLVDGYSHLPIMTDRPAHGSFRIKEIIECRGRLAVFDLDNAAIGDSVRDLALFLCDLHTEYKGQLLLNKMAFCFYRTYQSKVEWSVPFEYLQWHIRVQFIKRAFWIFKHKALLPDLERRVEKVLLTAVQCDPFGLKDCKPI